MPPLARRIRMYMASCLYVAAGSGSRQQSAVCVGAQPCRLPCAQGYLVVPGFLSKAEVARLNAAFDARWEERHRGSGAAKRKAVDQFHGMLQWPAPHCQPFRDLLTHSKLVPYLNSLLGRGWRLDHSPVMLTATANYDGPPGGGMSVHGSSAHEWRPGAYYTYANGEMRTGMLVSVPALSSL